MAGGQNSLQELGCLLNLDKEDEELLLELDQLQISSVENSINLQKLETQLPSVSNSRQAKSHIRKTDLPFIDDEEVLNWTDAHS